MARLTAFITLPSAAVDAADLELSSRLSQALLALGLEVQQANRMEIAALASQPPWECPLRLVISWNTRQPSTEGVTAAIELLSRESMSIGAPASRAALRRLLTGLAAQIPQLQVRSAAATDAPLAAASGPQET